MASRSMRQSTRCLYELDCMKRLFVSVFVLVLFVSGAELVQKYIGEGARMVRELFVMAREAAPTIIFYRRNSALPSSFR